MPSPEHEKQLFLAALERPTSAEREAFLREACGDDAGLYRRLQVLIAMHEQSRGPLDQPLSDPALVPPRAAAAGFVGTSAGQIAAEALAGQWRSTDTKPEPFAGIDTISLDFLVPADDPETLGRIGEYAVTEVIGRGGMGIVLKARDASLDRVVAIKVLAPELASNATARKRFLREAKTAAAVTHQHIVTIHAVGEDRLPYLVMECVSGQSLQEKLDQQGPLELREVLRIGTQVAAGLAAAHAHGVIHRDIKPANILLENGIERVRITDFGLARAADDVAMTRTGEVAGTPQYMSPEQAQGQPIDARSDLFSFGSVLYAMCTGRPPFRAETTIDAIRRVCDDTPRPIGEINAEVPEWLTEIIDCLLAKRPEERFQTAQEVAQLLGQHLAHVQDPGSTPFPHVIPPSPLREEGPGVRGRASRRWVAAAIVLCAALAALGATEATGVTHLAGTVIRIVTGEGTLIIEIDDPTVQVSLDGEELTISGGGVQQVRLRPGQYQFTATRDGRPVKQELVTITRGSHDVVKVKLETTNAGLTPIADAFTPLFDGQSLTGWFASGGGSGRWKVEQGALTCTGPRDHLLSIRDDFGDFHLRAEVRINAHGNSGIYFRAGNPLVLLGDYEAQITDNPGQTEKTGSLYALDTVSQSPVPRDTWFTLEIIAVARRIRILVNGQQTAEYIESRPGRNTQGHIALQHHDPETRVFFRKVEIKNLASSETGAFVLLGGKGVEIRKYDTLAEAVQGASDGDTIEVRGNGPFTTDPIRILQTALRIRAGTGFRPVLQLGPDGEETNEPLLQTDGDLVLEGLDFRRTIRRAWWKEGNAVPSFVTAGGSSLYVANCRLVTLGEYQACIHAVCRACTVRNCIFSGPSTSVWCGFPPTKNVRIDNCVHLGRAGLTMHYYEPIEQAIEVDVSRSTLVAVDDPAVHFGFFLAAKDVAESRAVKPIRFDTASNVIDANCALVVGKDLEALDPQADAALLRRSFAWRDEGSLYAVRKGYLGWTHIDDLRFSLPTFDEWKRFWGTPDAAGADGTIRYHGGDLAARLASTPDEVTPDDFRLRPDSAGYRAGPDGKDFGADVDLVGPGTAYERWKQTPEYQQWLEETGQADKPE